MATQKYKTASGWEVVNGLPPTLNGTTDPTTATPGYVGQLYLNTLTGDTFICKVAIGSSYAWVKITANADTALTSHNSAVNAHSDIRTALSNKEDVGYLTLNGTKYQIAVSTTDAGTAGYITFVIQS